MQELKRLVYRFPEAARKLDVSEKTISRMAASGRLKKVIISERTVGVTVDSVEAVAKGEAA
jgi:hypothetical protein